MLAPSPISTGTLSLLIAATQLRPFGTTWHTLPSDLRHPPPIDARQNSDWLT